MIGLMILLVAGIYLTVWVAIVIFSYNKTLKATQSKKQAFAVSAFFFLVMYLIPFWDLIPTLVVHKYYCSTQAEFIVYKDPEQWKKENPGVLDSLQPYEDFVPVKNSIGDGTKMNDRFGSLFSIERVGKLPIKRQTTTIVDLLNGEILVKSVDFSRGYGEFHNSKKGYWKIWLNSNYCGSHDERIGWVNKFRSFYVSLNMKRN